MGPSGIGISERLSYYRAWTQAESADVGAAYTTLVRQLRATAGSASHDAWLDKPIGSDAEMNIGPAKMNLTVIAPYEDAYQPGCRRPHTYKPRD